MRKPIIVFSLVMMLAPLPTFIPWVYDAWRSEGYTSWHAAPGHFRATGYMSMDGGVAQFMYTRNKPYPPYFLVEPLWEDWNAARSRIPVTCWSYSSTKP
jgi:hypothetical protein